MSSSKSAKYFVVQSLMVLMTLIIILLIWAFWQIFLAPVPMEEPQSSYRQAAVIDDDTEVRRRIYYRACRHQQEEVVSDDVGFINKSFDELEAEGYQVFWGENGRVIIFEEAPGLCPVDKSKRHLALLDGQLAVFEGPLGLKNADCLRVLSVRQDELPQDIIAALADGMEFADEESLLSALDSLDEL